MRDELDIKVNVTPYLDYPIRSGRFEKVSFEQFLKDVKSEFGSKWTDEEIRQFYIGIEKPVRATSGSAGYDFKSSIPFELNSWEEIKIPTGIRAIIKDGWWLMGAARSGMGFKYYVRFANIPPVIDSDYSGSSNEGHIWAKVRLEKDTTYLKVNAGDAFMQGIFTIHGITDDDEVDGIRDGGMGSTGV